MLSVAFLFPGQGSQKVGMGKDLFHSDESNRELFVRADQALSFSLTDIMFDGPLDVLTNTMYAQPAILTHSIAIYQNHLKSYAQKPDFVAGHSLGEYSALVAAEVLNFEDAVKAVHLRGKFMQEAVPKGKGAMAAVLGLDTDSIERICTDVSSAWLDEVVEIANFNGPDQTVISGSLKGVELATKALLEGGAKRVIPLPVSAPFHCRLMSPAAEKLAQHLKSIQFRVPKIRVVNNVDAKIESDPEKIRSLLVKQVVSPVRFTHILHYLKDQGVTSFVEMGPGKVLSGIVRRTLSNVDIANKEN